MLGVGAHKSVKLPNELSSALFSPSAQKCSSDGRKAQLCKNYGTLQGCRFGDKCHFEHVEEKRKVNGHMPEAGMKLEEKFLLRNVREPTPPGLGLAATTFGAVSTAKVSIAASLAGLIIGKGGLNAKAITRATGAKLIVKDHESDSNLKNIEMEGSFDQIQQANSLVKELLIYMDPAPTNPGSRGTLHYKTKLCDNFLKGSCTYGDRCHFAHGPDDLRASMQ